MSSRYNNTKLESSYLTRHSDTPAFKSSYYDTSGNIDGSSSLDQKRMSIIDGRLKVMPDQLSTARDMISRQSGDGQASEETVHVLQKTVTLDGESRLCVLSMRLVAFVDFLNSDIMMIRM